MVAESDAQRRFTTVFEGSYARVCAYISRRVPDQQAAADLVADVYLSAWRTLDELPPDPLPWLYRSAWHAIGNHRRSARRAANLIGRLRNETTTTTGARDPGDQVASADRARHALASLPAKDREAVQLLCWEQLTVSDAAQVLGYTETALTVRLHRARRALAAHLARLDAADHEPASRLTDRITEQST